MELEAIPSMINFTFSEPVMGTVTCMVKGTTLEKKVVIGRPDMKDYTKYYAWVSNYVTGDLLAEVQAAGEFSLCITLPDGTELAPAVFKLKKEELKAEFADPAGTIFAGLPESVAITLSADVEAAPKAKINGSYDVTCSPVEESASSYVVALSDLSEEAKEAVIASGELSVAILPDGSDTPVGNVKFYVVPADFDWTPAPGNESGKVFANLPDQLSYTLSASLPEDGIFESGIKLSGSESEALDIALAVKVEGTEVVFDLTALSGDDVQRIAENGGFKAELRLKNKTLSADYVLDARMQTLTLGYCTNDFASQFQSLGSEGAATTVGAAIRIPAAKLEGLKGGVINKLRIGMGAGMERVYAWIRPSLSQPAIVMKLMDDTSEGWHEVVLDEPYVITGEEIYIGYSGLQPVGVKAIRAGGADRQDACWLGIKTNWEDCSDKGYGALYIQAIGEAILPATDLGIDNLRLDKAYYKNDEQVLAEFSICNYGADVINSYSYSWTIGDGTPVDFTVNEPLEVGGVHQHSINVPLAGLADGLHSLSVECVVNDEGRVDQVVENNESAADVAIYSVSYPRTVLLEQFTTLNCVNCPNGTASIKNAVNGRTDIAWLAHHVGFGVDEFTVDEISTPLLDFEVAGAPSLMIDRTTLRGSYPPVTIGYSDTQAGGQVIGAYIDRCAGLPAFAGLEISQAYDADTRTLTVTLTGSKNAIFTNFTPACNYTIWLTEDDLQGKTDQAGAAEGYVHNHVIRTALTPTFGTPVEWDGDNFSVTLDAVIDPAWNPANMHIVAALNKAFDSENLSNCQILNSAVVAVDAPSSLDVTEGAEGTAPYMRNGVIVCDGAESVEVYSVTGIRLANTGLTPGMYLLKVVYHNGQTAVFKTYVK